MSEQSTVLFVLGGNEDGDIYFTRETEASLLKRLHPNEYGDIEIEASDILGPLLPASENTARWPGPFYLIIRGEIIVPKAKEVVMRFEL